MSIESWCHPTISFSVIPFSSCLQSFPASWSFPVSHFFASGGQSIRVDTNICYLSTLSLFIIFKIALAILGLLHFYIDFKISFPDPQRSSLEFLCYCCCCCCCAVTKSCPTLCNPRDCSMPGSSVLDCLPEIAQIHVSWVSDTVWTISSSVALLSCCLQSFPASGSFPMSQFFASGRKIFGASASVSVLSMNIQGWFPLVLTSLISLQSRGLSIVFSNTAVQKHQFLGAQFPYGPAFTSIHDY